MRRGAQVAYCDPFVDEIKEHGLDLRSVELNAEILHNAGLRAVLTPHSSFDVDRIAAEAKFVFDVRNAVSATAGASVVKL